MREEAKARQTAAPVRSRGNQTSHGLTPGSEAEAASCHYEPNGGGNRGGKGTEWGDRQLDLGSVMAAAVLGGGVRVAEGARGGERRRGEGSVGRCRTGRGCSWVFGSAVVAFASASRGLGGAVEDDDEGVAFWRMRGGGRLAKVRTGAQALGFAPSERMCGSLCVGLVPREGWEPDGNLSQVCFVLLLDDCAVIFLVVEIRTS